MLARALCKIGSATVPSGGLGVGGDAVLLRAQRLVVPPPPLRWPELAGVGVGTALVLSLPALGLLLPLA